MRGHAPRWIFALVVVGWMFLPVGSFAQQALSRARVVRLSYVSGTVGLKRAGAPDWTNAIVNTPLQEGFELSTSAHSYAEVQFENGSTARLGELSQLAFTQLALDAEGNKLNRLAFEQGYATFHFLPERNDAYSVSLAGATLTPSGKSVFRADFKQGWVRVEVFSGMVDVAGKSESTKLGRDKVLEFNSANQELAFNVQQGITKDAWDQWTEARDTQAELALRDQAVPGSRLYGWSDLGTYGEWAFIPGVGYGWAPYAPSGWSPYSLGMWANYPGYGMTWISAEPWGWLPYHCGLWDFADSFGWFWTPDSCYLWQPALVAWYGGPGWLGWMPALPSGAYLKPNPHPVRGQPVLGPPKPASGALRAVTTVPVNVVENGLLVTPKLTSHVMATQGTKIDPPSFPSLLVGGTGVALKAAPAPAAGGKETGQVAGSPPLMRNASAPATILMGGNAEAEKAFLQGHSNPLARVMGFSHDEPLHAREGTTLGGRFAMGGSVGEFHGEAPGHGGGMGAGGSAVVTSHSSGGAGPVVMSHASSGGGSYGGGSVHSGGGGGSVNVSSGASASSSSGGSGGASSGGGHH